MSDSKKDKLSEVSVLERYRKLKGEKSKIDLSEKIMEITRAGREYRCQVNNPSGRLHFLNY